MGLSPALFLVCWDLSFPWIHLQKKDRWLTLGQLKAALSLSGAVALGDEPPRLPFVALAMLAGNQHVPFSPALPPSFLSFLVSLT